MTLQGNKHTGDLSALAGLLDEPIRLDHTLITARLTGTALTVRMMVSAVPSPIGIGGGRVQRLAILDLDLFNRNGDVSAACEANFEECWDIPPRLPTSYARCRTLVEALGARMDLPPPLGGYETKEDLAHAIRSGEFVPAGKDLHGLDLSGCHIFGDNERDDEFEPDFSGCNLSGANFSACFIGGVLFRGAILDGATFRDANFEYTNFCRARGRGVDFSLVSTSGARFNDAVLPESTWDQASIWKTDFFATDFSNARMTNIETARGDFHGACFDGADLTGGTAGAIIDRGNPTRASSQGTRFDLGAEAQWNNMVDQCNAAHDTFSASERLAERKRLNASGSMCGDGLWTLRGYERLCDIDHATTQDPLVLDVLARREASYLALRDAALDLAQAQAPDHAEAAPDAADDDGPRLSM